MWTKIYHEDRALALTPGRGSSRVVFVSTVGAVAFAADFLAADGTGFLIHSDTGEVTRMLIGTDGLQRRSLKSITKPG